METVGPNIKMIIHHIQIPDAVSVVSKFDNVTSFLPDTDGIIETEGFSKFAPFNLKYLKMIRTVVMQELSVKRFFLKRFYSIYLREKYHHKRICVILHRNTTVRNCWE